MRRVVVRLFFALALGAVAPVIVPDNAASAQGHPAELNRQSPVDWLRHANDLTNIRLPGSAPFSMRVTFHAFPGIDFSKPGQSTIVTGIGSYEEAWVNPEKWRREVTLGGYHATEVRADGVRKMDASSDYEPSRVLMLLRALLYPVPREPLEPEIQNHPIRFRVEHLQAGSLPYIRISYPMDENGLLRRSFDLLLSGVLVRSEDYTGLTASWRDDAIFAGKLVPRQIDVQAAGLGKDLITADITIEPLGGFDPAIFRIPGEPADPGSTLRPFDMYDLHVGQPFHFEVPKPWSSSGGSNDYPVGMETDAVVIVDRHGMPKEAELTALRQLGQTPGPPQLAVLQAMAQNAVQSLWKDRFRPGLVDGSPCEYQFGLRNSPYPAVQ